MYRKATLLIMAALLAVTLVAPPAGAAKNPKTTFASECAARGGTLDDQGTAKPTDDTCVVVETYRVWHPQGYWVYHEKTTEYDRNFAVVDEQDVITGCNFVDRPYAEPTVPPAPVEQCPPNILI